MSRWEDLAKTHINRDPNEYDTEFIVKVQYDSKTYNIPISRAEIQDTRSAMLEDFKEIRALVGGEFSELSDTELRALLESLSFTISDYIERYAWHKAKLIHDITLKSKIRENKKPSEKKAVKSENLKCEFCGSKISKRVMNYCNEHKSDFDGKILCFDCQKTYKANKEPLPANDDDFEILRVG
jgi:hypothetical protein